MRNHRKHAVTMKKALFATKSHYTQHNGHAVRREREEKKMCGDNDTHAGHHVDLQQTWSAREPANKPKKSSTSQKLKMEGGNF